MAKDPLSELFLFCANKSMTYLSFFLILHFKTQNNMKQVNLRKSVFFAFLLFSTFLLFSCEHVFDYSIYSAKVDTKDKDIRESNFERLKPIQDLMSDTSSFSIALLSDSHTYFDDLKKCR